MDAHGGDAAGEEEEGGEDEDDVQVDAAQPQRQRHRGAQRRVGRGLEHRGPIGRRLAGAAVAQAIPAGTHPPGPPGGSFLRCRGSRRERDGEEEREASSSSLVRPASPASRSPSRPLDVALHGSTGVFVRGCGRSRPPPGSCLPALRALPVFSLFSGKTSL